MNFFKRLLRHWRYGDEVIVVSGLPRSGTSMLMKMLEAGGVAVMVDHVRGSDEDNPKGYYEYERVKDLEQEPDKSWLQEARGKVIKVISHLLKALPEDNFYLVILVRRDLNEVVASQNIMLDRRGEPNPVGDEKAIDLYGKHLLNAKVYVRRKPNFRLLEVRYNDAVQDPLSCAKRIDGFLSKGLDVESMAAVVDTSLYRNRNTGIS
jgi:hypothetical protein